MTELLLRADGLITMDEAPESGPAAVLTAGEKIVALGREALETCSGAARVVDLPGLTLMPGLIDCHNHLAMDPTLDNYLQKMNDPIPVQTLRAARTMKVDLGAGVTTARCLGDKEFLDLACKQAQAAGELPGPRLTVATRGFRAPHGHGFVGYPLSGVENFRTEVRENLAAGADIVKLFMTGTVMSPQGLPCFLSPEEVRVAVEEARRAGKPTAAHCIGGEGLDIALKEGIDVIEHGYFMTPEQIELLAESNSWLVMTPGFYFYDERVAKLPPELVEIPPQQRHLLAETMTRALKAGVRYALGTDGMHGELAREARYLTSFGATNREAIAAVTINAARVCRMEDRVGSLAPGKLADLVGVRGDPRADITALSKVDLVVQNGRIFKDERDNR